MRAKKNFRYGLCLVLITSLFIITSCEKDDPLSDLTGITSFGFTNDIIKDYPFTVDNSTFVIKNSDSLPYQFDVSNLIAQFSFIDGSTVTVGGTPQISGTSSNNFSNSVTYDVTAEDAITTRSYRVEVNVAKINPEGVKWNKTNPNAFDETFETQEYFYLNGKHFVIVGKKFAWFVSTAESKLYSSVDGTSWNEETISGDFPLGYSHNIVVKDNKAYVLGHVSGVDTWGADQPSLENNLYTSEDGVNWTKNEEALDISRILSPVEVVDGSIFAFGGNLQGGFGSFTGSKDLDALYFPASAISQTTLISNDGATFTASAEYTAEMPRRTHAASYVLDGKMHIVGGLDVLGYPLSDIWSSTDGVTWTMVSDGAFSARLKTSTVVYDAKVWMFGGQLGDGTCTSEILVSEDGGVSWSTVESDQMLPVDFTARCAADVTVDEDGQLWIVGGESTAITTNADTGDIEIETTILTDVWSGKLNKL